MFVRTFLAIVLALPASPALALLCDGGQRAEYLLAELSGAATETPITAHITIGCGDNLAQIRYAAGNGVIQARLRQGPQGAVLEEEGGGRWNLRSSYHLWTGQWSDGKRSYPVLARIAPPFEKPPKELAGTLRHHHTINVLDGQQWVPSKVTDVLSMTPMANGFVKVSLEAVFENAHQCSLDGPAVYGSGRLVMVRGGERSETRGKDTVFVPDACVVQFEFLDGKTMVKLDSAGAEACRQFCGARGYLDGLEFSKEPPPQPKKGRAAQGAARK